MKINDILIVVENLNLIKDLKKLGINKYAFPIKDFCVGIPNSFLVSDIKIDGYIYINRILETDGIEKLKELKPVILENKHIKGIIFDDLGVLSIFKNENLELILYMTHFLCSSMEVNEYLKYVDSVILSTDITLEEIKYIVNKSDKLVSLFTFGLVSTMYSRRLLIDNYSDYYNILSSNPLKIKNDNNGFILYENKYGTIIYHDHYFFDKELFNLKAKHYFYNPVFLNKEQILNVLQNNFSDIKVDSGFLYKKSIYKLSEEGEK